MQTPTAGGDSSPSAPSSILFPHLPRTRRCYPLDVFPRNYAMVVNPNRCPLMIVPSAKRRAPTFNQCLYIIFIIDSWGVSSFEKVCLFRPEPNIVFFYSSSVSNPAPSLNLMHLTPSISVSTRRTVIIYS